MKISNSSMQAFWTCPLKFYETYLNGLQGPETSALQFGSRFHQRLQAHYQGLTGAGMGVVPPAPLLDSQIELETLSMYEAYRGAYPTESFNVIEVEKRFELPIPDSTHTYVGRFDALVRDKASGKLQIFETKTESRSSRRNLPKAWTARTQGSLYCWAAQELFGEPVDTVILNVCTKASDKGQIGPSFRRDLLHRSPEQLQMALADLTYVAAQISALMGSNSDCGPNGEVSWPANRNACVSDTGWACEFWDLHNIGRTEELLGQLVQIEPYSYLSM